MLNIDSLRTMLKYSDWANGAILESAASLGDAQLDQPFDMGVGSLRKTLIHIYNGEYVWLNRGQGRAETKWPSEEEQATPATVRERLQQSWRDRDAFLATLKDADPARDVTYRDSKGSLFHAALSDMMMQMFVHSTHHRAQAVNMIRRVGGSPPDVDYMYWMRKPA